MNIVNIPGAVKSYREWFDIFSRALGGHTDGILFEELREWFLDSDEELDGQKPQRGCDEDVDKLDDCIRDVGRQLARWELVTLAEDRTRRRTTLLRLRLPPEARMRLSPAGVSLAKRPQWVRDAEILRRILGTLGVRALDKMRVPLAIVNLIIIVVRVAGNWNTISATTLSVVAGVLLLLASLGRWGGDHH